MTTSRNKAQGPPGVQGPALPRSVPTGLPCRCGEAGSQAPTQGRDLKEVALRPLAGAGWQGLLPWPVPDVQRALSRCSQRNQISATSHIQTALASERAPGPRLHGGLQGRTMCMHFSKLTRLLSAQSCCGASSHSWRQRPVLCTDACAARPCHSSSGYWSLSHYPAALSLSQPLWPPSSQSCSSLGAAAWVAVTSHYRDALSWFLSCPSAETERVERFPGRVSEHPDISRLSVTLKLQYAFDNLR